MVEEIVLKLRIHTFNIQKTSVKVGQIPSPKVASSGSLGWMSECPCIEIFERTVVNAVIVAGVNASWETGLVLD